MRDLLTSLIRHEHRVFAQKDVAFSNPLNSEIGSLKNHSALCNACNVALHYRYENEMSRCGKFGGVDTRLPTFGNAGGEVDWEALDHTAAMPMAASVLAILNYQHDKSDEAANRADDIAEEDDSTREQRKWHSECCAAYHVAHFYCMQGYSSFSGNPHADLRSDRVPFSAFSNE